MELYYRAKITLHLFDKSELPMGQLYALECIAEQKEIKIYTFPKSILKKNADYEKFALYHLSTEQYKKLTKDEP